MFNFHTANPILRGENMEDYEIKSIMEQYEDLVKNMGLHYNSLNTKLQLDESSKIQTGEDLKENLDLFESLLATILNRLDVILEREGKSI